MNNTKPYTELVVGDVIMIKDCPCRILDHSRWVTGRHRFLKVWVLGIDLETGEKLEDVFPGRASAVVLL